MLNHVRRGGGEPLVLVHGIGSHLQMWSPVLDRMSCEHDVLALDLPGFGRSPQLDREPTLRHVVGFDWTHGDLGVPVTIGWGTRDMLLIPRQARRARRRMPRARHVWLRGCGHVPTWDGPERVASLLLAGARDA